MLFLFLVIYNDQKWSFRHLDFFFKFHCWFIWKYTNISYVKHNKQVYKASKFGSFLKLLMLALYVLLLNRLNWYLYIYCELRGLARMFGSAAQLIIGPATNRLDGHASHLD